MKILAIIASAIIGLFPSQNLGTAIPNSPALVDTYLAENITATQNTMTLVNGKLRTGQDLSGYICFTLDASTPTVEYVCGTAAGASITGMTRGVNLMNPNVSGTGYSHRRFSSVQVTDYPTLQVIVRKMNGVDAMDVPLYYSNGSSTFITSGEQLANKAYVDFVGSTNPADASETVRGVVQLSTPALTSIGSSTGVVRLVPSGSQYNATSAASVTPVTNSSGKISKTFLSFVSSGGIPFIPLIQYATTTVTSTINYGYTGSVASFYASSTITSSTITVIGSGPSGKGGKVVGSFIPTVGTTYYLRVGSGGEMSWFGTANTISTSTVLLIGGGGGSQGATWSGSNNYGGPGAGGDAGLPDGSGGAQNTYSTVLGPSGAGAGGSQTAGGGGGAPYGSCGGGSAGGTGGSGSLFTAGSGGSQVGGQYGTNGGGSGGQGFYGGGGGGAGWGSCFGSGSNGSSGSGGGGGSSYISSLMAATSSVTGFQTGNGSSTIEYAYTQSSESMQPTIVGTNTAGTVTFPTSTPNINPTSLTMTFGSPGFSSPPICIVTTYSTTTGYMATSSQTSVTFNFNTAMGNKKFNYICLN